MANTRTPNWKDTLKKANEELAGKAEIVVTEEDGTYQVDIKTEETFENFASGYYECELSECILDALHHAKTDEEFITKAVEWLDKNTAFYATFDENEDSSYEETKQNFLKNFADAMRKI